MDESTLAEDITSDLCKRGYDVMEGQGEWPIVVRGDDGMIYGVTIIDISDYEQ